MFSRKFVFWCLCFIIIAMFAINYVLFLKKWDVEAYTSDMIIGNEFEYGTQDSSDIPNIIWTFWDGPPNKFVELCMKSWAFHNPDYQINILTKQNYRQYVDDDIDTITHSGDGIARYSDYVRLAVLSKYGGIWSDASILCNAPYSWIHGIRTSTNAEYIGYFFDGFTKDEFLHSSPVIENWFFACVPNSKFVSDWYDEFFGTRDFDRIDDYIESVKNENVDCQKIDGLNYLAMHVSAQKILQKNGGKYNIAVVSACSSAFKYLCDSDFDTKKAVDKLFGGVGGLNEPIIKFRGAERDYATTFM